MNAEALRKGPGVTFTIRDRDIYGFLIPGLAFPVFLIKKSSPQKSIR